MALTTDLTRLPDSVGAIASTSCWTSRRRTSPIRFAPSDASTWFSSAPFRSRIAEGLYRRPCLFNATPSPAARRNDSIAALTRIDSLAGSVPARRSRMRSSRAVRASAGVARKGVALDFLASRSYAFPQYEGLQLHRLDRSMAHPVLWRA